MTTRHHYLPPSRTLDQLSTVDRSLVFELHQRQIVEEIEGLKSGEIHVTDGKGRAHHIRLAQARMRRLAKVAQSYGQWEAA